MLTPNKRGRLTDTQDRLIDLFVRQQEARIVEDWERVRGLQTEIDQLQTQANLIREPY